MYYVVLCVGVVPRAVTDHIILVILHHIISYQEMFHQHASIRSKKQSKSQQQVPRFQTLPEMQTVLERVPFFLADRLHEGYH